jgi:hypothetical protein
MARLVQFAWLVVVRDKVIAQSKSEARARRRCIKERERGVDARLAEAWFSTGTTEQP